MDLIERDHVLAALADAGRRGDVGARTGRLVVAPAGGGKTSVLEAVRRMAADRGVGCWPPPGVEQETVIPYGVVHQLIDPLVRRRPELVLDGPAARAWATAGDRRGRPLAAAWAPLVDRRSPTETGPILLVIDDHQWVDRPSAAFVDYLAHRMTPSRMALVVATRDAGHHVGHRGARRTRSVSTSGR